MLYSEGHEYKVSFGLTPFSELWLAKLDWRVGVVIGSPCCVFSEAGAAFVTSRYLDFDKALPVEMHVFCDACPTTAAGCCVFFAQNEKVRFISSKVKLSSSKHARTVPQWELIAMVMGARLGVAIREIFSKDFPTISSWSRHHFV